MSEIKLLPCPFCGGEAKLYSGIGYAVVGCKKEDCQGSACCYKYNSKKEAIEQWNTRKPMERIIERLEEERKYSYENFKDEERAWRKGLRTAIKIVKEEVEQYRALGTVEELKEAKKLLEKLEELKFENEQPKTDWIPCTVVNHPEHCNDCEVTIKDTIGYFRDIAYYTDKWRRLADETPVNVIAWKEPSRPYKKEGAE